MKFKVGDKFFGTRHKSVPNKLIYTIVDLNKGEYLLKDSGGYTFWCRSDALESDVIRGYYKKPNGDIIKKRLGIK